MCLRYTIKRSVQTQFAYRDDGISDALEAMIDLDLISVVRPMYTRWLAMSELV